MKARRKHHDPLGYEGQYTSSDTRLIYLRARVDELVLHWARLAGGAEEAIQVLRRGSHGYPTNAFVTSVSDRELGLVDGADCDRAIADAVVQSLMAVIVAAYDAETFMVWEPSDRRRRD